MALTKVDISLVDNATGFTIVTKVVTVAASKLVIDGVSQDTLTLTEGYTYKFDTSHATMSGHTVSFATAADAAGSTQYTTGVTTSGTPGNAGAYTQIVVAQSAPVLYYYCANHASMGGTISTPAAVIANKLLAYDGSGNLPAVDGSQLTNVSTATSSASDPVVSTNPSGGVGTEWHNTTSGEVYICTDATAGANVWTNIGAGSGDIQLWIFPGESYGYVMGGFTPTYQDTIQKYSYTSDGDAIDVSNLIVARGFHAGIASAIYGYSAGGQSTNNTIDKFSYSAGTNATDVGNLVQGMSDIQGASSETNGYTMSGSTQAYANMIQKFAIASDGDATDIGNTTVPRYATGGVSSATYGYAHGGYQWPSPNGSDVIDKFSFSSDGDATDVGNLLTGTWGNSGQSSETYGYESKSNVTYEIQKWAFASDGNAIDVADLLNTSYYTSGSSSTTYGYNAGGWPASNQIEKFSFTSDINSVDVGNTLVAIGAGAGTQY